MKIFLWLLMKTELNMSAKKETKNYLKNEEMLKYIHLYHQKGFIDKRLHEMFYILAERIARTPLFSMKINELIKTSNDNDYYNELVNSGYLKCISKLDKFSLTNKNPFSYFTTIVFNSFRDYFYAEKKFDIMKPIPPVLFKEFMFTFIESANTMQHKNL